MERSLDRTGLHFMLALFGTAFSTLLTIVTILFGWELWMVPLLCFAVLLLWVFHIGRLVSDMAYEHLFAGLMLAELFFYGVHETSCYDIAVLIVIAVFLFSVTNDKLLLDLVVLLYVFVLLYQYIVLHTLHPGMPVIDIIRVILGIIAAVCSMWLARYMMNRRIAVEENLQRKSLQLEDSKKQNAEFLSNVSHELRTPINMVIGISDIAMERETLREVWEDMRSIQVAGRRLSRQVSDILDYTEIVGNTLVTVEEQYMVASAFNDVITATSLMNANSRLEIIFDIDVDIPAVLVGDIDKIRRVLKILVDNAVKFTEEGGIYICISYRKEDYGINLEIDVCDTGSGISESGMRHMFEDFYQSDSGNTRKASGLGLGLAIAHGLLQAMGGFFYFESAENKGTKIHATIPQKVLDDRPGMSLDRAKDLHIVCYFKADRNRRREVREYYDALIRHMANGFHVDIHRVYHFKELENLVNKLPITHIFVSAEQYRKHRVRMDKLSGKPQIVLVDGDDFVPDDSRIVRINRPLNTISIVNLLNSDLLYGEYAETNGEARRLVCEGVCALVVDDEEMNLIVAQGILSSYGMQVDLAGGGEEAVEMCLKTSYDIVFLDHMMPGIDGVETLKRIRALKADDYRTLPVIALTANAISGAKEMFLHEGFTEFVPKPIDRHVLERVLRRVLPDRVTERTRDGGIRSAEPQETQQDIPVSEPLPEQMPQDATEGLRRAGMDVELGIQYCGGSEEFYEEMLRMFYDQRSAKRQELVACYEEADWGTYGIRVHALKSTALTIGATDLSRHAKELEMAGKEGRSALIRERNSLLLEQYDSICNAVAAYLGIADGSEGGEGQ